MAISYKEKQLRATAIGSYYEKTVKVGGKSVKRFYQQLEGKTRSVSRQEYFLWKRNKKEIIRDNQLTSYGKQYVKNLEEGYKQGKINEQQYLNEKDVIMEYTEFIGEYKVKNLTVSQIKARAADGWIQKKIASTGQNPRDIAEELGVTLAELSDSNNWSMEYDTFTNPHTGISYRFIFQYQDYAYFEEVQV